METWNLWIISKQEGSTLYSLENSFEWKPEKKYVCDLAVLPLYSLENSFEWKQLWLSPIGFG